MRIILTTLLAMVLPSAALAADYTPVVCATSTPYTGAPIFPTDFGPLIDRVPASATRPMSADVVERLHKGLSQALAATKAKAISAAVIAPDGGVWSEDMGALSPGRDMFFWASAGKSFTAVAILQLAEEGRLNLNDSISKWVKGVPNGDAITLQHLLTHTSGLFSSNEDLVFHKAPHHLSLAEDLKILNAHGAIFCPGENWHYSNSGYDLLGEVIEQVEGRPYATVIQTRIINKLGLTHMRAIGPDDRLGDVVLPISATEASIDPREPGAAGAIVANSRDMVSYEQALLSGKLLKPETVKAMFRTLYPMFGQPMFYGEGVMVYALPDGGLWLGHSGGAPGVKAVFAYSAKQKAFVAVAIVGDQGAEATANLLFSMLTSP